MVDNYAARTSDQPPEVGQKRGWVSKTVILGIFVAIIAALVLLS